MTGVGPAYISKSAVDKAGMTLRRTMLSGVDDPGTLRRALDVATAFRATWAAPPQPLAKVSMGLRSMARSVTPGRVRVAQRLKRLHRIVEKLSRREHQTMRLSQMEDIGGCRVVLPSLSALNGLRDRVLETWHARLREVHDYIAAPKADGYRAVHVIVIRDERLIEIQLRTQRQHLWATHVERLEMTRREVLRGGRGSADTVDALRGIAEAFANADAGDGVTADALLGYVQVWLAQLTDKA